MTETTGKMSVTMIRHFCDCGNTHADKKSAIICSHDKLEDTTMPRAPSNGASDTAKKKSAAKKKAIAKRNQAKGKTKVS